MPKQAIDVSAEDYEVLSIHSSDNELAEYSLNDQEYAPGALTDNLNDNLTEEASDCEPESSDAQRGSSGESSIDTLNDDAPLGDDEESFASAAAARLQSIWNFPSGQLETSGIIASLDYGIDSPVDEKCVPTSALRQPYVEIPMKEWRDVIVPRPNKKRKVRYIVMSGSYSPQCQPFIFKLHEKFPRMHLIWVDTQTHTSDWVTNRFDRMPSRHQLVKHGIRMDFYSGKKGEHSPSVHKFIDESVIPGFLKLGIIPVSLPGADAGESLASINSPVEIDVYGCPRPLSNPESIERIERAHLGAVLSSRELVSVRNIIKARGRRGPPLRRTLLQPTSPLSLVFGALILFSVLALSPLIGGSSGQGMLQWLSYISHGFRNPVNTNYGQGLTTPAVTDPTLSKFKELAVWTSQKNLRGTFDEIKKLPSAVRVPSIEELEEAFRNLAIYIHKLTVQACAAAHAWSDEHLDFIRARAVNSLQSIQEKNPLLRIDKEALMSSEFFKSAKLFKPWAGSFTRLKSLNLLKSFNPQHALNNAHDRLADALNDMVESKVHPLWTLGRQHAAQWIH